MARTGRRPGQSRSREKILGAARSHFAAGGYDGATIRGIAKAARVDPALVLHYFGSKEGVFVAAMKLPADPAQVIPALVAPGIDGIGERLVRFFIGTWDSVEGRPLLGLLRSVVSNEKAAELFRGFLTRELFGRLTVELRIDQPELRTSLAMSQMVGLALQRYVLKLEPVASASIDDIARWVGPSVQRYFSADIGRARRARARRREKG